MRQDDSYRAVSPPAAPVAVDDLVSVATRLGLLAGDGEILITEATYRMVREATEVERLEAPIELRGGGEPAVAWRLVGIHDPGGDAFGTLAGGT